MEKVIYEPLISGFRLALKTLSESPAEKLREMIRTCDEIKKHALDKNCQHLADFSAEFKTHLIAIEEIHQQYPIPAEDLFVLDFLLTDAIDTYESYLKSVEAGGDSEDLKKKKIVPLSLLVGWKPAGFSPKAKSQEVVKEVVAAAPVVHIATTEQRKDGLYLLFKYRNQDYGIEISHVKEIVKAQPLMELPQSGARMLGMLNLRGGVLPILNIDEVLGFKDLQNGQYIIVCQYGDNEFGLPVEITDRVVTLPGKSFHALDASSQGKNSALQEYSILEDKTILILDLTRVAA